MQLVLAESWGMGKRNDTLETTLLAIELLRRIPRSGWASAVDLHRQLHEAGFRRDLRSIQRLLKSLCEDERFGLEQDTRSKPYGYRWLPNASGLAVANLSAQQSMLLMMAQEHLRNLLPASLMKSMDSYFQQARHNLTNSAHAKLEKEWPQKALVVATTQPMIPPTIKPRVFDVVSEALYQNKWLKLDYRNSAGKYVKAQIMPLGLAQQGERIYLACRFDGYENERSIALHRIQSAEMMTLGFERPKDFNLKQYDEDGRFSFGQGLRVLLSFRTTEGNAKHLAEVMLSADQKLKPRKDGFVDVTATVVDDRRLDFWLSGMSDDVSRIKKKPFNTT